MPCSFRDETSTTTVMGAGTAGSWEFGASTPSLTGGIVTVDGVSLILTTSFLLGNGLAGSSSLNRVTGSLSIGAGQGTTATVDTSSKSDYTVVSWAAQNSTALVNQLNTTTIQFMNSSSSGATTVPYSWL